MGLTDTLRQVRDLYEQMTEIADRVEEAERRLTDGGDEARWKMAEAAEKADRLLERLDRYAWTVLGIAVLARARGWEPWSRSTSTSCCCGRRVPGR